MNIVMTERDESWLYGADVAVPLELTLRADTLTVEYYPSAKDIACELLRRYSEETLFSRDAVMWAAESFDKFLSRFGFSLSPDAWDFYLGWELSACDVEEHCEVRRLNGDESLRDLTDTDIKGLCEGGYLVYAMVVDGCIAAVANTGEPVDGDTHGCVEIGVDTAEEYRRRGYASACAAALVGELSKLGIAAVYECASGNAASAALAKKLGGKAIYKKYYAVGFSDRQ